jgi:hypothetical protein
MRRRLAEGMASGPLYEQALRQGAWKPVCGLVGGRRYHRQGASMLSNGEKYEGAKFGRGDPYMARWAVICGQVEGTAPPSMERSRSADQCMYQGRWREGWPHGQG